MSDMKSVWNIQIEVIARDCERKTIFTPPQTSREGAIEWMKQNTCEAGDASRFWYVEDIIIRERIVDRESMPFSKIGFGQK